MKKTLTILAFLAVVSTGAALAEEGCLVPMADWQPRDAVAQLAAEQGWTVRRIRIDDGCYQIVGRDAQGRQIEVTLHPGTLEVVEIEYEDAGHEGSHGARTREDEE